MGNCQAIDNATLVVQQPSGRADKFYSPVAATDIMKMNPGHYVALLLTTTLYPSTTTKPNDQPLRITRIKLLRPTDTLLLGHTYRLISAQEVMKGLWAKKYAKMQKKQTDETSSDHHLHTTTTTTTAGAGVTRHDLDKKTNQVLKHDRHHRPRTASSSSSSSTAKPKGWHPSLQSISEARN